MSFLRIIGIVKGDDYMIRLTRRGAHTFVELVVAVASVSVLMAGLSSAVFIALKATDSANTPTSATIEGAAALDALLSDLEFADSFSEIAANAITFTVPDRDGDDIPETIRFAWSGVPGSPLTRQYNGGAVATLVDNVHVFQHDLPVPSPNLLTNADMESDTASWQAIPGATMYSQGAVVHTGTKSLYCYRNTANDESGLRQNVMGQLVNGTQYEVSAWMRKWAAAQPFDVKILLRVTSSGEGEKTFDSPQFAVNNSNFLLVRGFVTPTWSGTLLSAYWEATGISKIQEIYVDDAVLRVKQSSDQRVRVNLQVGSDARGRVQSGVAFLNLPL